MSLFLEVHNPKEEVEQQQQTVSPDPEEEEEVKGEEAQKPHKLSDLMAAKKVKTLVDLKYRLEEDYSNATKVRADVAEEIESLRKTVTELESKIYNKLEGWISSEEERLQGLIHKIDQEQNEKTLIKLLETAEIELSFKEENCVLSKIETLDLRKYLSVGINKEFMTSVFAGKGMFEHFVTENKDDAIRPTKKMAKLEECAKKHGFSEALTFTGETADALAGAQVYKPCSPKDDNNKILLCTVNASTPFIARVKGSFICEETKYDWKEEIRFTSVAWKEACKWCPNQYFTISQDNPIVAISSVQGEKCITVTPALPLRKTTKWNIKITNAKSNVCNGIYIGVSPFEINQNEDDYYNGGLFRASARSGEQGWYLHCYDSTLRSGPPHNCRGKEYGPRKENGQYVHTGDSVGVVMDTAKSELSFVVNGVNLGVAYDGIPLDKPLVPCVKATYAGDSVEFTHL